MKLKYGLIGATALLTLASACSDESSTNTVTNTAGTEENASAMANDPNNPFAQTEMQMNERMMAAVGADASDTWVRKMIEHHRGAVEMSNILLPESQDTNVRQMAQMTIDKQSKEIQELEKLVRQGAAPSQESANLYRPGEMQMHEKMMAATGATIDESWMRKMIEHHRGAVAMSDVVLAQNPTAQVRAMAQKTRSDQMKEIEHLEAMLSGANPMAASAEPAPVARSTQASAPKVEPTSKSAPAPVTKDTPKETSKAAPKAAAKAEPKAEPKATTPTTSTCAPEHRAMGHC